MRLEDLGKVLHDIHVESGDIPQQAREEQVTRLVGESDAIKNVRKLIAQVAPTTAAVLITGESGTGKELIARSIHEKSGRKGDFIAINCGAIPSQLIESELFGHERGAFTGATAARVGHIEAAHHGTLFLDEIGDMPATAQVKLLRVLEEREIQRIGSTESIAVDFRLIAATHRDLTALIEDSEFREDLYYRLSVFPIEVPPLRQRQDDIEPLIEEFNRLSAAAGRPTLQFTENAVKALSDREWPGNVRELANVIERFRVMHQGSEVQAKRLDEMSTVEEEPPIEAAAGESTALPQNGLDLREHIAAVECGIIEAALDEADGVVQRAADQLGIGRTTLVEKIRRFDLSRKDD
ncbi:MAG: sigma-54 dependent transcriptional regulator [Pseudomonadota bacterium]